MERQIQTAGKRPWGGAELIKMQDELYRAIEAILSPYNKNFILTGCIITGSGPYDISPGIVFIDGNICEFEGASVGSTQVFLNKEISEATFKIYGDSISHPTEKHYKAIVGSDASPYIELADAPYFRNVLAPISDSLQLASSDVYASAAAINALYNMVSAVQHYTDATVDLYYRKAHGIVQVKLYPISLSAGSAFFTFPTAYRPLDDVLIPVGDTGVLKVQPDGGFRLQSGTLQYTPSDFYYINFPVF